MNEQSFDVDINDWLKSKPIPSDPTTCHCSPELRMRIENTRKANIKFRFGRMQFILKIVEFYLCIRIKMPCPCPSPRFLHRNSFVNYHSRITCASIDKHTHTLTRTHLPAGHTQERCGVLLLMCIDGAHRNSLCVSYRSPKRHVWMVCWLLAGVSQYQLNGLEFMHSLPAQSSQPYLLYTHTRARTRRHAPALFSVQLV